MTTCQATPSGVAFFMGVVCCHIRTIVREYTELRLRRASLEFRLLSKGVSKACTMQVLDGVPLLVAP